MTLTQRIVGLVLILVSLGLLYPGVTEPVIHISGQVEKSDLVELGVDLMMGDNPSGQPMVNMLVQMLGLDRIDGSLEVYQQTRSIWGTVTELMAGGDRLVAILVMLFSVIIPITKQCLQLLCIVVSFSSVRQPVLAFNAMISKWSMADVFLMALIVTYMASNATGHGDQLIQMQARFGTGFYFFLAYCIFSITASGWLYFSARQVAESETDLQSLSQPES